MEADMKNTVTEGQAVLSGVSAAQCTVEVRVDDDEQLWNY